MKHSYIDEQATAAAEEYMERHPAVDWDSCVVEMAQRDGVWIATGHRPCWLCKAFEEPVR